MKIVLFTIGGAIFVVFLIVFLVNQPGSPKELIKGFSAGQLPGFVVAAIAILIVGALCVAMGGLSLFQKGLSFLVTSVLERSSRKQDHPFGPRGKV